MGNPIFLARSEVGAGEHRALDLAGFQRRELRRLIAELQNSDVLVGVESVFFQSIAHREVGRRTITGNADGFSFELIRPGDAAFGVELERQRVDDAGDHHDVGAAQVALDRCRAGDRGEADIAGNQCLRRGRAGLDQNRLNLESIFAKEAFILRDPQRRHVSRDRAVGDVDFLQSVGRRPREDCARS